MKRLLALIVSTSLLLLAACGKVLPEAGVEIAAREHAIEITPAIKAPSEEQAKASITEIDMSAPENQQYRDWLDAYHAQSPVQENKPVLPEPSMQPKTNKPDDKAFRQWLSEWGDFDNYGQKKGWEESWKTWNWSDDWELEYFNYSKGWTSWEALRARNKITNETQVITQTFGDRQFDGAYSFPSLIGIIDEMLVVYQISVHDQDSIHFFVLGQGSMSFPQSHHTSYWAFANEECTLLYCMVQDYENKSNLLYFVDLLKMAAGENGAIIEFRGVYSPRLSPDDRCLLLTMLGDNIMIYDNAAGYQVYSGQLPEPQNRSHKLAWANANTLYYFTNPWDGPRIATDQVTLYEITLEFPD